MIKEPSYTPGDLEVITKADRITFHRYAGRNSTIVAAFEIKENNGQRLVREALKYAQDILPKYGDRLVINLSAEIRHERRYLSMPCNFIPEAVR